MAPNFRCFAGADSVAYGLSTNSVPWLIKIKIKTALNSIKQIRSSGQLDKARTVPDLDKARNIEPRKIHVEQ
jgi:hypothetical protein